MIAPSNLRKEIIYALACLGTCFKENGIVRLSKFYTFFKSNLPKKLLAVPTKQYLWPSKSTLLPTMNSNASFGAILCASSILFFK